MAQRGKPSLAHVYNERGECIHCSMYRVNVEQSSHVCKPWRENLVDELAAKEVGISVEDYRLGRDLMHRGQTNGQ
jgi:hypothetical protein